MITQLAQAIWNTRAARPSNLQTLCPFMFPFGRTITIVLFGLLSLRSADAKLTESDRSRIAAQIDAAVDNLDPSRLPNLQSSQAETLDRIRAAKEFFRRTTSQQNSEAWLQYLDLQPLATAIESDSSPAAVGREALALQYRLIGIAPGLELTVLRKLRDSVIRLIAAVRFRDPDKSIEQLSRQLQTLADRVRNLDDRPGAEDAAAISAMIDILQTSGQAGDVVNSLRNTFNRPNASILIGESLVQDAVFQNVNQTRPVNECILGTRILGNATLQGKVSADLLPSVGAVRVQVSLTGDLSSSNIGYNGPVRLYTTGYGGVFASRAMSVSEAGIVLEPVFVVAQMHTQINSIQPKSPFASRIVRRIAQKRAAEQKPQADAIANGRLRVQLSDQFASQTDQQASIEIPDFMKDVRPVLKRLDLAEPLRLWGSTDRFVFIDATIRRDDQITTVDSRPTIRGVFAAAVQIHESAINNAATPILAGRTVNETQLADLLKQAGRDLPAASGADGGANEEESAPFEISFARLRPVVFEARDQRVRIGIRGTRFAQGSRELNRAMEISALYQPEIQPDGSVILGRIGDVDIDFPGNNRLSVSQAGLKSTMLKKFSNIFPQVLLDRPLVVPATVKMDAIRGKTFRPRVVDAMNGWLTVAVQ